MAKAKTNSFEDFLEWHPIFDGTKVALGDIKADKFNSEQHPQIAAMFLVKHGKESGDDETVIHSNIKKMGSGTQSEVEEKVSDALKTGNKIYRDRLEEMFNKKFNALYRDTPDEVKKELYANLQLAKPKKTIRNLPAKYADAVKLHRSIHDIYDKLVRYESDKSTPTERKKIEKEMNEELAEHYKKVYLNTPKKKKENQKLVDMLNKWAKDAPEIGHNRLKALYVKQKKEFEEKVKESDLKDYITTVFSTDTLRQLYAVTSSSYEKMQDHKRQAKNSDYTALMSA
jgi:hypothetical protein